MLKKEQNQENRIEDFPKNGINREKGSNITKIMVLQEKLFKLTEIELIVYAFILGLNKLH